MKKTLFPAFVLFFLLNAICSSAQNTWTAPAEADQLVSTLPNISANIEAGKKIFQSLCTACHGDSGKGDGVAAAGLTPKPTDFTSPSFQKQSDGAIFWKLTNGRGVMASYEKMLSEKDRWAIVVYLRSLSNTTGKKKTLN